MLRPIHLQLELNSLIITFLSVYLESTSNQSKFADLSVNGLLFDSHIPNPTLGVSSVCPINIFCI